MFQYGDSNCLKPNPEFLNSNMEIIKQSLESVPQCSIESLLIILICLQRYFKSVGRTI